MILESDSQSDQKMFQSKKGQAKDQRQFLILTAVTVQSTESIIVQPPCRPLEFSSRLHLCWVL